MSFAFSFDRTPGPATFRILTVCTGNICRSPFAEQYLRRGLRSAGLDHILLESAGTMAQDGQAMPPPAVDLASRYGVADAASHKARYLFEGHIAGADLVLGMGLEHRKAVVSLFPRASRYAFTLREFARLSADMTIDDLAESASLDSSDIAGRLRAAVSSVAARRGLVAPAASPIDEDIVDPYKLDEAVYEQSGRQLVPAADVLIRLFTAAVTARDPRKTEH